jgi:hypothetical protein
MWCAYLCGVCVRLEGWVYVVWMLEYLCESMCVECVCGVCMCICARVWFWGVHVDVGVCLGVCLDGFVGALVS